MRTPAVFKEGLPCLPTVRKGQAPPPHPRETFRKIFFQNFYDPAFDPERAAIDRLEAIAWDAYQEAARRRARARPGPASPTPTTTCRSNGCETRERLQAAQARWQRAGHAVARAADLRLRPRNDGTCPGEISKTWRLTQIAREALRAEAHRSRPAGPEPARPPTTTATSIPARAACRPRCRCATGPAAATRTTRWARPATGWPRSTSGGCRRTACMLLTPVYWYQAASPLKLMMDRLVCADGGNPDPTTTHGKKPAKAKALELQGWPYPKHLAGRTYGVVVHGDVAGIEGVRRALCDWLDWMGLIDAGPRSAAGPLHRLLRALRHQPRRAGRGPCGGREVRNMARAVARAVQEVRKGTLSAPDRGLRPPRQKYDQSWRWRWRWRRRWRWRWRRWRRWRRCRCRGAGVGAGAVQVPVQTDSSSFAARETNPTARSSRSAKCDQACRCRGGIQVGYAGDASSIAVAAARPDIGERQS